VDVETCRVSLANIDTRVGDSKIHYFKEAHLTVGTDGRLSLLHMPIGSYQLQVWTRQEDGGHSRWLRGPDVDLKPHRWMNRLISGEKGGMLLLENYRGDVNTADLQTGEMEKVASCSTINRSQIVPFEMDWPTFFVSYLGNR
jgi:hypothetical protein